MKIVPAILTSDPAELDGLLRQIRDRKKFERVQIDFIDGEYANNKTIRPMDCDLIPFFPIKFDAQLMVVENNVWEWCRTAKKMGFDRIIPQVESISEPQKFVEDAQEDIKMLVRLRNEKGYKYKIWVDGGIDQEHLKILENLGVDEAAVGAKRV